MMMMMMIKICTSNTQETERSHAIVVRKFKKDLLQTATVAKICMLK